MIFWALTDLRWCATWVWLFAWCRTDVPCHLVMRYTSSPPLYPISWPERRGIPHKAIEPTFPSEWRSQEQEEAGDTLTHSLQPHVEHLPRPFWFLLTAVPDPWQPASHSGVYHLTLPTEPIYTLLDYETWTAPGP